MLSAESEVLSRHQPLFEGKSLLFFGHLKDQFPRQVHQAKSVQLFSSYFDFARHDQAVQFGVECYLEADLGIFYWAKNKQENIFQLLQWLASMPLGQQLLIVGENRSGVRSVENLLAPLGELHKIDSARRCSLFAFRLTQAVNFEEQKFWKSYRLPSLNIFALPAVFSSAELDSGSALLLSSFADSKLQGKVLDLGCGAGVIGARLKQHSPQIALTMSDIHAMALRSSERTLAENQLEGKVVASDVFSHINDRFDLIVSNPPFHDGIDTAYRAVETLIAEAKSHLNRGGELRLVANAFLPYPDLLDQAFGSHQVLAKSNKFKVYSAKAQ